MLNCLKTVPVLVFALLFSGCSTGNGFVVPDGNDNAEQNTEPDPRALELFMDAQLSMAQGDYSSAIIDLQDALRIDPNVGTMYTAMGESYLQLGKFKLAEERLNRAIELEPSDKEAYTLLSHVYLRMQDYKNAEKIFYSLKKIDPENIEVYYAIADLKRAQKDTRGAIDLYIEVFNFYPEYIKPLELASELAFQIKDMVLAQKIYTMMIKAEPENIHILKTYSDLAFINNDTANGLAALKKVMELPDSGIRDKVRYGAVMIEFGMTDSSLAILNEVLEEDPANVEALHLMSQMYRSKKQYGKSSEYAERYINFHPDDARGYINLALNAFDEDRPEDVIDALDSVANIFELNFSIQYILGMAYYLEKYDSLALRFLYKSVELNQDAAQAWHAIATVEEKNKNYTVSDRIYLDLIDRDSTDAQARNNYAYSLVERGINVDEALRLSEKAIALDPDNAAYLDTYGWIQFKLGNYNNALEYIKRSAELSGENDVILEHLGDVYKALDNDELSLKYYKLALKFNPDKKSLREKIEN